MKLDDIIGAFSKTWHNKLNLKMESVYEKEFALMQKNKEDKARDNIVKGIEEIEKLKKQNLYKNNSVSSDAFYNKNQVTARSTNYDRTLMSTYSLLSGLFEPHGFQQFDENLKWQPVTVNTSWPESKDPVI